MWGSEAVALGLSHSGIGLVSTHDSVKAAEIAAALHALPVGERPAFEVHLSPARAVESAIAAASVGEGAAVVLPSRAFAPGASPLHAVAERGTSSALVIVLIEDPGCEMTPAEIDSRYLARELYMPILEPSSLGEALSLCREAPALSEAWGQPVMVRLVVRLLDTRGLLEISPPPAVKRARGRGAAPELAPMALGAYGGEAATHARVRRLDAVSAAVENLLYNRAELTPPSDMLIVAVGAAYTATRDALVLIGMESTVQLVKVATPFPLPRNLLASAMRKAKRVLVVEELEPYVETRLSEIANKEGLPTQVRGKVFIPRGGELTPWDVADGLGRFAGISPPVDEKRVETIERVVREVLPRRAPSLPASHAMRTAIEAAESFARSRKGAAVVVEAPPEWRVALEGVAALYFGDWGEGLGVGCALARRAKGFVVVVTEGRGVVSGLSALREAQAERLPLMAVVSPQGLSADVERALPGAHHHGLDLRALAAALGLGTDAIVHAGETDRAGLEAAMASASSGAKGPRILTFGPPAPQPGGA